MYRPEFQFVLDLVEAALAERRQFLKLVDDYPNLYVGPHVKNAIRRCALFLSWTLLNKEFSREDQWNTCLSFLYTKAFLMYYFATEILPIGLTSSMLTRAFGPMIFCLELHHDA